MKNNNILIIGDIHMKDSLGYADYITDNRIAEKQRILDFIVEKSKDCGKVVYLGDNLNGRTNSPHVIKEFVRFLERFSDKKLYILAGNHEKFGDGRSAIDFLKEIKNPNWHIITDIVETIDDITFCPYFTKAELKAKSKKEALAAILKKLKPANMLFHHHAMTTGKIVAGLGIANEHLLEPVLPIDKLKKLYKFIVGGHIHTPTRVCEQVLVAGSIFTNEIGEVKKYIWKINEKYELTDYLLPTRGLYKFENPTDAEFEKIPKESIVKLTLTKQLSTQEMLTLKEKLSKFDAYLLLERIPRQKKKLHYGGGESLLEFDIEKLLETYSEEKKVDLALLKRGFELIK